MLYWLRAAGSGPDEVDHVAVPNRRSAPRAPLRVRVGAANQIVVLLELERRNAEREQSTDACVAVVHDGLHTAPRENVRATETGRTCADAVRNLATHYPYDAHVEGHLSLRGSTDEVAKRLKSEIQDRLAKAGVEVIEARISHLAYAPEIAAAMLRRQQAGAIIAARAKIVEGAVGMVEMALDMLAQSGKVQLDEERKAAMVSNLLVVLCADREAQPVVNTGTIYH